MPLLLICTIILHVWYYITVVLESIGSTTTSRKRKKPSGDLDLTGNMFYCWECKLHTKSFCTASLSSCFNQQNHYKNKHIMVSFADISDFIPSTQIHFFFILLNSYFIITFTLNSDGGRCLQQMQK